MVNTIFKYASKKAKEGTDEIEQLPEPLPAEQPQVIQADSTAQPGILFFNLF